MAEAESSPLVTKIDNAISSRGNDDVLTSAIHFHLTCLKDSNIESEIESKDEMLQYLFSKMFLDKLDLYPSKHFSCQVDENSDHWSLKPVPSELFGKLEQTKIYRKHQFYETLCVGNILACQVKKVFPVGCGCEMKVLHKSGVPAYLSDLDLMIKFIPSKKERKVLNKTKKALSDLEEDNIIRVAVVAINQDKNICVTVDKTASEILVNKNIPELGIMSKKDLPDYVVNPDKYSKFSCYVEYLKHKPQFLHPHSFNQIIDLFGISPKRIYSFYPQYNDHESPEDKTTQTLYKNTKLNEVKKIANDVLKELEKKNYAESLKLIEKGLAICPKNDLIFSKLYEIRSDALIGQKKPKYTEECFADLEKGYKLNPSNVDIKKKLIKLSFKAANGLYRDKKYDQAFIAFKFILELDENHPHAAILLNRIKDRHADQLPIDFEEKSLTDLEQTKTEIMKQLEKL